MDIQSPRSQSVDVLVIGGGPAGIGAAVAAARQGARTLLVESQGRLGGAATSSLVCGIIRTTGWDTGIFHEFLQELEALDCVRHEPGGIHYIYNVVPDVYAILAANKVMEAGAEILFRTRVGDLLHDGDTVTGATLLNRSGRTQIRAAVTIDCTGDGVIAAQAGVPCDLGDPQDGRLQAVSLNFQLAGVEPDKLMAPDAFIARSRQAIADGKLDLPAYLTELPGWWVSPSRVQHGLQLFQLDLNTQIDPTDAASLSRGELECQQRIFQLWRFLRTLPGYQQSILNRVASSLGVREGRRIHGHYTLTADDVLNARKFPDGIAPSSFYMDLHDGQAKDAAYVRSLSPPEGDHYEIPYRCLVPVDVQGLLVAGRCLSSTREANGSARLQITCMHMGQAAGTAAALCASDDIQPAHLDGTTLRAHLAES